jgi:hypothetical protein
VSVLLLLELENRVFAIIRARLISVPGFSQAAKTGYPRHVPGAPVRGKILLFGSTRSTCIDLGYDSEHRCIVFPHHRMSQNTQNEFAASFVDDKKDNGSVVHLEDSEDQTTFQVEVSEAEDKRLRRKIHA